MRFLAPIVLASLALNLAVIDHGDPIAVDRAIDAIHPLSSLDLTQRQADTELKYPPLHFRITGLVERAWLRASLGADGARRFVVDLVARPHVFVPGVDVAAQDATGRTLHRLIVVGRCVSALMGALVVLFVALLARELFGSTAARIAGALAAVSWPLAWYSHQLNLDVPYLAWSFLALWLAARAARAGRPRDLVLAALAAACAIGTKDQAYGLFVLTAPAVLYLYMHPLRGPGATGSTVETRKMPWGACAVGVLLAAALLLVFPGIPIDWDWHRRHLEHLANSGSEPYRVDPRTLAGQWTLVRGVAHLVALGMGLPAAVLGAAAFVFAIVRDLKRSLIVVAAFVSYVATFLIPAGFAYLRFTMPLQLLAIVLIGAWLARAIDGASRPARFGALALVVLLVAHGAWGAIGVDRFLASDDTRSRAERWLRANATPATRIHTVLDAPAVNVIPPPWPLVTMQTPGAPPAGLDRSPPDLIVVSFFEYFDPSHAGERGAHANADVLHQFGRTYDVVERFEPAVDHVLRECVAAQPVVWIYRARS